MRFEWDPLKAEINRRKHGVGFGLAQGVFSDPVALTVADEGPWDEERWITLGSVAGTLLFVVHSEYDFEGEEYVRIISIISARRATRQERRDYERR